MVIGSGRSSSARLPSSIMQAFRRCRALREEGHRVVLVNSNPATIMTDPEIADAVYLEPLTAQSIEENHPRASAPMRCFQLWAGRPASISPSSSMRRAYLRATASSCSVRRSKRFGSPKTGSA